MDGLAFSERFPPPCKIFCLDIGQNNIGVALSDETQGLAVPLGTFHREGTTLKKVAGMEEVRI